MNKINEPVAWLDPDSNDVATNAELDYRGKEHSERVRSIYTVPLFINPVFTEWEISEMLDYSKVGENFYPYSSEEKQKWADLKRKLSEIVGK